MTLGRFFDWALNRFRRGPTPVWSRIEQVLAGALEVPQQDRQGYLDRACAGDAVLRAEVSALLAASDGTGLLDHPLEGMLSRLTDGDLPTVEAEAPQVVSHFELLARISTGGMGVVYRARDTRLQRIVALKFLPSALTSDSRAKSRFLLEARAAAALDHRNVCAIHEIGQTADGQLFISMPFYDGETLADRLRRGALKTKEAVAIASQICLGLAHAHERGVVHRDIKPANLMLTPEGVVKILDFGIVKLAGAGFTRTGAAVGTLPYMSPEQLRCESVDARTDLWSLGVVLYEMLAGRRPFEGPGDHSVREAIAFAHPPSLQAVRTDIPQELSRLITHLLSKHPTDRPVDIQVVVEALEVLQRSLPPDPAESADVIGVRQSHDGETAGPSLVDSTQVLPEGERRQATIVVLALSGYADLVEHCAPQEVDEVIRRFKRDAWEIVDRHGGTVNEFSEERIVLAFGVPVTLEDHCVRATRAAFDLRRLVRALRTTRPTHPSLALHAAIDTGETAVQRLEASIVPYRIAGRPVRRAAQLCAHAHTDEILLAPDAERAVAARFRLAPAGSVALADEPTPMTTFLVIDERAEVDRLDQMADRDDLTEFTGRDSELTALTGAFAEAVDGRGRLVTVSGEAGLGKSRLLLEFRRAVDPVSTQILIGRCSSYGQATAYIPFLQALRQLLRLESSLGRAWTDVDVAARVVEIDAALEPLLPYYLRLLSISTERYRLATPERDEQGRLAVMEALVALFIAAAKDRPVTLLLEDWHWVDTASHETLKRLVDVVSVHRLLVVMTSRAMQYQEWSHHDPHHAIVLRPLSSGPISAMLRSVLQADDVPDELLLRLHERTGGNPFFLEEVTRSLIESGTIRIEGRRVSLVGSPESLHMPASAQAVIRTRLDRFDLEARQVLRAAAVVGRDFTYELLARVVANPERVGRALDLLSAAGVVRQTALVPEHTYAFAHALIQEAAYAGLLEHQRADLHARVGTALEALYAGHLDDRLDRLAQHFSLAENWPKAVHFGLAAAERARGLYQLVDALGLLDRTREWSALLEEEMRRDTLIDILFRQERLCDLLGMRDRQRQIADELVSILEASDDPRLAEAYLHEGELLTILHEFEQAEVALEQSLRLRRAAGDALGERASLRGLGFLRWSQRRYEDALACNEAALVIDRRQHRLNAVVGDLHNLGSVHAAMGHLDRARDCFEEALALSEPAKHGANPDAVDMWQVRVPVLYSYGCLLARSGDLDGALAYLDSDGEWMSDGHNPQHEGNFFTAAANVHLKKGMIAECLADHRRAIDATRQNHIAPQLAQALQSYGETLITLSRERDALTALEEAARIHETLSDRRAEALTWSHIARVRERLGDAADAQSAWQRALSLHRDVADSAGEIDALEGLGRVARRHLPSAVALRFYEEAIDRATIINDDSRAARLHNSAGIIEWTRAQYESALAHFEQALRQFEMLGDRVAAGQIMNSIAVTLSAFGRTAAARQRLLQALAHHERIGNAQLAAHALAALGDSYSDAGEHLEAASWYERSLEKRTAIADLRGEGWMLQRLARAKAMLGASEEADALLTRATEISIACSDEELMESCMHLRHRMPSSPSTHRDSIAQQS